MQFVVLSNDPTYTQFAPFKYKLELNIIHI